ncbi:GNAT family N-acetyltransferase [Solwaraspora sp. WMMB335]|uniref:GNAT family N-acetyltransferase n=1 Tax=Solwaraspora sp. WMMB335 TaxID=3404118 RepID=UPI003B936B75
MDQNVVGWPPLQSRVPAHQRLRIRAGYEWRNSSNPILTALRVGWDTRSWAEFPAVRSHVGGLSISYAGLPEGVAYTLEFTEQRRENGSGDSVVRESSTIQGNSLLTPRALPDADIVIVGTNAARARRLPRPSSLVVPIRVHFVVDFDDDTEAVMLRASKHSRRDFRQQSRKFDWGFGIARDSSWFEYFYERMYQATMAQRYGGRARTESRDTAYECLFRSGILFYLSMNGERVAGHLCHWDRATGVLTSRLLGVLDGREDYYAAGALKIMYFRMIEWAGRNGVKRLDLQGTEAFLSKGTFQMKRRYGTRVILPPNHFGNKRLWLQVRRDTPQVRDFLVANPILAEGDDSLLEGIYFYDERRPARVDYQAEAPGVDRVRHVDLDMFLSERQTAPNTD